MDNKLFVLDAIPSDDLQCLDVFKDKDDSHENVSLTSDTFSLQSLPPTSRAKHHSYRA